MGGGSLMGAIATDSRKAGEGELFVAIVGKTHDAHGFVKGVVERGVAAVLVHREVAADVVALAQEKEVAIILVDDTTVGAEPVGGGVSRGDGRGRRIAGAGDCGGGVEWEDDDEADYSCAVVGEV